MSDELQEVRCHECGASLGYQGPGEIQWDYWQHSRCPVRLARRLGITREAYDMAAAIATAAVAAAYPDFPNNVLEQPGVVDDAQTLRARIAAEMVLERLGGRFNMELRA
jgi:hypothetical protein